MIAISNWLITSVSTLKIPHECALRECHVFLIEDDGPLRAELAETLMSAGLNVHAFDSAESCLDVGVDLSPAVIVSDMVLPGQSGIDLFKSIREQSIETPVVFISGYSEPKQIIDGMKLGAVDFLWKPFKGEALLEVVAKSLTLDLERQASLSVSTDIEARWITLSDREKEVGKLMLKGHGNKDVAAILSIQPDTANKHRMKVLKKMGVAGRPQLLELLKDCPLTHS